MVAARAENLPREKTAHFYLDTRYRADSWARERRVVIKAEVVQLSGRQPRDNPRFVVTNLRQTPRFIYEKVYGGRGDIENRIKELHDGLQIDRTSCHRFLGDPTAGPADGRRLRAHAGTATQSRSHRLRPHPGDLVARPTAQARRPRRPVRPPHRPASAAEVPRQVDAFGQTSGAFGQEPSLGRRVSCPYVAAAAGSGRRKGQT